MGFVAAAIGFGVAAAGHEGAGEQYGIDLDMVELTYQDNLEKIRRRKFEQDQTQGIAQAFSQNAGVTHHGGSTAQGYLDVMATEFKRELDWMKKYAKEARNLGVESASVDYKTNRMAAIKSGISTGASVYGMGS